MDLKPATAINITLSPKSEQIQNDDQFCVDFDVTSANSRQAIPLQNLHTGIIREGWSGLQATTEHADWQCFHNDEFLLAKVPSAISSDALVSTAMDTVTQQAYSAIFELMQELGYSHLCRTWNYFSEITGGDALPHNHYQLFCSGRSRAYQQYQQPQQYPAATVVGLPKDGLHIYFLAAKHAGHAIENPQQVSAYEYPKQYSQDAPLFARALLHRTSTQTLFFVSGTASIIGHSSQHIDDVRQQTHACLDNIEALIETGQEQHALDIASLAQFTQFKVYVKHAQDLPLIEDQIQQRCGQQAQIVYLHADLCRSDLLVEIEACHIQDSLS